MGKKLTLSENQSTYIPLGEKPELSNPGDTPVEIVEVQSGDYLGEDDIVRFEDHYGRKMMGKSRIYVAGHRGMVGQALVSLLKNKNLGRLLPGLRRT